MRSVMISALFLSVASATESPGRAAPQGLCWAALCPGPHKFSVAGVNIWYRVAGRRSGVPVVFLHGGPGEGSQTFQAFGGPGLEKTERIVYLDQRGAGRSDRPKDASAYSLAILVDDIEALRKHLGVPRIGLVGHSFGTVLGLEYAAKYPMHISALVLAAAVPDWPKQADLLCSRLATVDATAFERAKAAVKPGSSAACNLFAAFPHGGFQQFVDANMFPHPAIAKRVNELDNAEGVKNDGFIGNALISKGLLNYHFHDAARVKIPVLIIAGGKDRQAAIEPQRDLAKALPDARLLEYPNNGHFMFVEDPNRFARDVTAFLRKIAPRRTMTARQD